MVDHIYKSIELTGSSAVGVEDAVNLGFRHALLDGSVLAARDASGAIGARVRRSGDGQGCGEGGEGGYADETLLHC